MVGWGLHGVAALLLLATAVVALPAANVIMNTVLAAPAPTSTIALFGSPHQRQECIGEEQHNDLLGVVLVCSCALCDVHADLCPMSARAAPSSYMT